MARTVIQYDLLISCPGDIKSEISIIQKVVNDFNNTFGDVLGITLRTKHWSKNSYPQSGGKPQALLNEQFVKDCDAAIAMFWTRFGTPTDEYGSGTEEEIEIMLEAGKQVFMYFSDKPVPPSQNNADEYARVKAFQESFKDRGIYYTYSSDEDFEKKLYAHLSQHFLSEKRVAEVKAERKSQLCLRGIDASGNLNTTVPFQKYDFGAAEQIDIISAEIQKLYQKISDIHVASRTNSFTVLNKPVVINEDRITVIKFMAEKIPFSLPEDFFNIGSLSETLSLSPSIFGGRNYDGTEKEKEKYNLIESLYLKILSLSNWLEMQRNFADLMCIKLALTNLGTTIDEDIDVTLVLPQSAYKTLDEFPSLSEDTLHFLTRDCDMSDLLGIRSTSLYNNYDSALKKTPQLSHYQSPTPLLGGVDYSEEYREALEDIFCYDVYPNSETYILKLKFDYIKHHTTVAFPAAILLNERISSIQYTITSKNSAEIIEGELIIE